MCDAADPKRCHTCKPRPWIRPVLQKNGTCGESCAAVGEFFDSFGACVACDATCANCDGPGDEACTSCALGGATPLFHRGRCLAACPVGFAADAGGGACRPCHHTCGSCAAPADASACTSCSTRGTLFLARGGDVGGCSARCPVGEYGREGVCALCDDGCARCTRAGACAECSPGLVLLAGECAAASGAPPTEAATTDGLFVLANQLTVMARGGKLDTGYEVTSMGMQTPTLRTSKPAVNVTRVATFEKQRLIIVGNAPASPTLPDPPRPVSPPLLPPTPTTDRSPPSPAPFLPPPVPPAPPPAPLGPGTPLAGDLVLHFNGEATEGVDLAAVAQYALGYAEGRGADDAASLFVEALSELSTTASSYDENPAIAVQVNAVLNASASTVTLLVDVAFHPHELVTSPLNLGSLPLIKLDASSATGILQADVSALRKGAAPLNMTYPEQELTLGISAATFVNLVGKMRLVFDNATTPPFAPDASASSVREALQELDNVGEVEVFRTELADADADGAFAGYKWTVRFYATGDPSHIGPQPPLTLDVSGLALASQNGTRRQLSLGALGITVTSVTSVLGESPYDPADSSDEAAQAQVVVDSVIPSNESVSAVTQLAFTPVVHICGNGVRSTAEACDDNNTVGGDGCSALCAIEEGFECVSTADAAGGSGIGGLDACSPICGDGKRIPWITTDECDDNNTVGGDGCSAGCTIEAGYQCSGGSLSAMDACASVCGDGLRVGAEGCDDGNQVSLDGCDAACAIEDGSTCSGGNSTARDVCVPCAASCNTCFGPLPTECVTCASAFPFFDAPSSCLASCLPASKYADGEGVCQPCDATCGACTGATSVECASCVLTLTLTLTLSLARLPDASS